MMNSYARTWNAEVKLVPRQHAHIYCVLYARGVCVPVCRFYSCAKYSDSHCNFPLYFTIVAIVSKYLRAACHVFRKNRARMSVFSRVTHKNLEVISAKVHFAHRMGAITHVSLHHDLCGLWA